MTTVFSPLQTAKTLTSSVFHDYAETIAPGISAAVDSVRKSDEDWPDTLQRVLISLTATDQQRLLLLELAQVGRDAIASGNDVKAPTVALPQAAPSSDGLLKIIAWTGAAMTVFNWL